MKRKSLNIRRYPVATSNAEGDIIAGTPEDGVIKASVQPVTGEAMQRVAELEGYGKAYRLFSSDSVNVAQPGVASADQIEIYGEFCEVVQCQPWQNGIRNHFEILVAK